MVSSCDLGYDLLYDILLLRLSYAIIMPKCGHFFDAAYTLRGLCYRVTLGAALSTYPCGVGSMASDIKSRGTRRTLADVFAVYFGYIMDNEEAQLL